MALSFGSTEKDRVAYLLRSRSYSNLPSHEQTVIDGGGADALKTVQKYAGFLTQDGSDTAADAYLPWLVSEAAKRAAYTLRPDLLPDIRAQRDDDRREALLHTTAEFDETSSTKGLVNSTINFRRRIISACVRRERPIFPEPDDVDRAIKSAITRVWEATIWPFRRRQVTATIGTDGSTTWSGSVTPADLCGDALEYTDSAGLGSYCRSVGPERFADFKARLTGQTGRPSMMRVTGSSAGALSIEYDRTPDQQYTARAEVAIATPGLLTVSAIDTAIGQMPPKLQDMALELATAHTLRRLAASGSADAMAEAEEMIAEAVRQYANPGPSNAEPTGYRRMDDFGVDYYGTGWTTLGGVL